MISLKVRVILSDWADFAQRCCLIGEGLLPTRLTCLVLRESHYLLLILLVSYITVLKYPGYTWSVDY